MAPEIVAAVCGAIAGAVMGGLASFVTELCLTKHRKVEALGLSLAEQIDSLCGTVAAYWASSGQDLSLEQQIIRSFEALRSKVGRFTKIKSMESDQNVERILKDVYVHATGGLFGTVRRDPEPSNAEHVSSQLRVLAELLKIQ